MSSDVTPHYVNNGSTDQRILDYERKQIRSSILNYGTHYINSTAKSQIVR